MAVVQQADEHELACDGSDEATKLTKGDADCVLNSSDGAAQFPPGSTDAGDDTSGNVSGSGSGGGSSSKDKCQSQNGSNGWTNEDDAFEGSSGKVSGSGSGKGGSSDAGSGSGKGKEKEDDAGSGSGSGCGSGRGSGLDGLSKAQREATADGWNHEDDARDDCSGSGSGSGRGGFVGTADGFPDSQLPGATDNVGDNAVGDDADVGDSGGSSFGKWQRESVEDDAGDDCSGSGNSRRDFDGLSSDEAQQEDAATSNSATGPGANRTSLHRDGPSVSLGSAQHPDECNPCSFYCYSLRGCRNLDGCEFCHQFHESKIRKRRSAWKKAQRAKRVPPKEPKRGKAAERREGAKSSIPDAAASPQPALEANLRPALKVEFVAGQPRPAAPWKPATSLAAKNHVVVATADIQADVCSNTAVGLCEVGATRVGKREKAQRKQRREHAGREINVAPVATLAAPVATLPNGFTAPCGAGLELGVGAPPPLAAAYFSYTPNSVVARIGQRVELWPPVINSAPLVYAVAPKLPGGLTIDRHTGYIGGITEEATDGSSTFFITACEQRSVITNVRLAIIHLNVVNCFASGFTTPGLSGASLVRPELQVSPLPLMEDTLRHHALLPTPLPASHGREHALAVHLRSQLLEQELADIAHVPQTLHPAMPSHSREHALAAHLRLKLEQVQEELLVGRPETEAAAEAAVAAAVSSTAFSTPMTWTSRYL